MFSPERDKDGNPLIRFHAIPSPTNEHARLTGCFDFTIPANSTASQEYLMAFERLLDGIKYKAENCNFGDKITLQVIHPQAGVVDEFGKDWPASCEETIRLYKAKIYAGLSVRVTYTNTGVSPVRFIGGLFLHEVVL